MASKTRDSGGEMRERLNAITAELNEIRQQLRLNPQAVEANGSATLLDDPAGVSSLRAFKHEVDELRIFLWKWVNEAANGIGLNPTSEHHSGRIRRATELLQALTHGKSVHAHATLDGSFMESVYRIVDKAGSV